MTQSTPAPIGVIGVDVGTTNTKVVLVLVDGSRVVEADVRSIPTTTDADVLLAGIETAIRETTAAPAAPISAVGIASMAETGVPLDARSRALGPLLGWQGGAARDALLVRTLEDPARFAATGVPATPKPALVALARLHRDDPELAGRLRRWAGSADLVALRLTGRLGTDHTLALRTAAVRLPPPGLPGPTEYDDELAAPFGVPVDVLPPIAPVAAVSALAAERTGLAAGTPVVVAGHDHLVGAWAVGVRGPGRVADSLGTAEALVRLPAEPLDRLRLAGRGSSVLRAVDGDREALLTAATGAGAAVAAWFGGVPADGVLAEAAALLPSLGDLLVLPYPAGRQAPHPDPGATMRLVGLDGRPVDPGRVAPAHAARALLLGLALHAVWMDEEQRSSTGVGPEPWTVLGGAGAANRAWLAIKSAVASAPMEVAMAAQPVAAGAALLAGVRTGALPPEVRLGAEPLTTPRSPEAGRLLAAFRAAALGTRPGGRP